MGARLGAIALRKEYTLRMIDKKLPRKITAEESVTGDRIKLND
jgi:hypothetical protein